MGLALILDLILLSALLYVCIYTVRRYKAIRQIVPVDLPGESTEDFTAAALQTAQKTAATLEKMHNRLGACTMELRSEHERLSLEMEKLGDGEANPDKFTELKERLDSIESRLAVAVQWQRRALVLSNALSEERGEVLEHAEMTRREEALDGLAQEFEASMEDAALNADLAMKQLKIVSS